MSDADARKAMIKWITRLMRYGAGHEDLELDHMTFSQILDRILAETRSD